MMLDESQQTGRSRLYSMNSIGPSPRTDLCGTPQVNGAGSDVYVLQSN